MTLLERLGVELPVVQAGMGGGVAGHELAAAVSEAGGLGTLGIADPGVLRREIRAARERTSRPIAVNLLLPFARPGHWEAAADADAIVTFWGPPRRRGAGLWLHQVGSVDEARAAQAAGADGVIVQGVEAGGHVRGTDPALELLERVRAAVGPDLPLWLAGGIADAGDVRRALEAGAEAAVLGTRFLMTEESRAHPQYKARVAAATDTVLTELFSAGWPAAHRVIPNRAVERWDGNPWVRRLHRVTAPLVSRTPPRMAARFGSSLLAPIPPTAGGPEVLLERGPLYAGETARRIGDVRPAGPLTRELSPHPPIPAA